MLILVAIRQGSTKDVIHRLVQGFSVRDPPDRKPRELQDDSAGKNAWDQWVIESSLGIHYQKRKSVIPFFAHCLNFCRTNAFFLRQHCIELSHSLNVRVFVVRLDHLPIANNVIENHQVVPGRDSFSDHSRYAGIFALSASIKIRSNEPEPILHELSQ